MQVTANKGDACFHVKMREAPADLQVKYDELVQYTLMLEKQKKKLEDHLLGFC